MVQGLHPTACVRLGRHPQSIEIPTQLGKQKKRTDIHAFKPQSNSTTMSGPKLDVPGFAPKLEPLKYLNKGSGMFIFAPKLEPLKYLNIKGVAPNWMVIFASKLEPLKYLNIKGVVPNWMFIFAPKLEPLKYFIIYKGYPCM